MDPTAAACSIETIPPEQAPFKELEAKVSLALQRYANVHRGAGQHAQVSTRLYEGARLAVLEYFGVDQKNCCAIFGNRRALSHVRRSVAPDEPVFQVFSNDLGLPLGIGVLVVRKRALRRGFPPQRGGGTVNLVSKKYVIWKDVPERFEAGTPNILGAITLAVALQLIKRHRRIDLFRRGVAWSDEPTREPSEQEDWIETDSEPGRPENYGERVLGWNAAVPTARGLVPFVNLDIAASTPIFQSVWEAVRQTLSQSDAELRTLPATVVTLCSEFFNAPLDEYDVIFVSNATEGLNIVAESFRQPGSRHRGTRRAVMISGLEHNSNELPWRYLPGVTILRLPVNDEGFIAERQLELILRVCNRERRTGSRRVELVALSGCSNVVGSMNDLRKIGSIVHRYGASFLVDAAQLAAHRRIDMSAVGIDYLVCSGHKMYAPFGAGLMIARKGLLALESDELSRIRNLGSENVAGIAALGRAIAILSRIGMERICRREKELMRRTLEGLHRIPGVQVFGVSDSTSERFGKRGPVIAFRLKNVHHNLAAKLLAETGGIGIRSGCFCAHLFVKQIMSISPLQSFGSTIAMLLTPRRIEEALPGILRVSFSFLNTEQEIDHFLRILLQIATTPIPLLNRLFARLYYGTPLLPVTPEQRRIEQWIASLETGVYGDT